MDKINFLASEQDLGSIFGGVEKEFAIKFPLTQNLQFHRLSDWKAIRLIEDKISSRFRQDGLYFSETSLPTRHIPPQTAIRLSPDPA